MCTVRVRSRNDALRVPFPASHPTGCDTHPRLFPVTRDPPSTILGVPGSLHSQICRVRVGWVGMQRQGPKESLIQPARRSRRGPASPKALRKDPSLPLLAFTGCQESAASLVCKGITSICLHHPCHPPYTCLSGCKFPSSPKDTSHWTRALPNPERPHFSF